MTPGGRALVAAPRLPAPDRDRGSLRLLDMISALRVAGWEVVVCGLRDEAETRRDRRRLEQAGFEAHIGLSSPLVAQIESGAFSLALLARWVAAEQLLAALHTAPVRPAVIVDSVDLHFLRHARYRSATAGAERNVHEANVDFFGRELDAYAAADAVLVVSDKEADILAEVTGSRAGIHVLPLAAPASPSPLAAEDRRGLLFVGSFRHIPNLEAVDHLCTAIIPRLEPYLLSRHPLTVVGGNLPAELGDRVRETPGVKVVGRVPEVVPYLHRARLSVVPLLHGAGVKGKILESLASGTPVVATSVSIEGTDLEPGTHLAVADDAWHFATEVEDLLDDDDRWQRLSDAGSAHVARAHDPAALQARFLDIVDAVASPGGRANRPVTASAATRWTTEYQRLGDGFEAEVLAVTPPDAKVLVVSGGDERLLMLRGRTTAHFPQGADGGHAGFNPVDGEAAVSHLRALADRGAGFLAVPSASLWWLHRYRALHEHLGRACRRVHRGEHGSVYELEPAVRRWHLVVVAPAGVAGAIRAFPPSACTVDVTGWEGSAPPGPDRLHGADLVVLVKDGTVLPPGFLDRLATRTKEAALDVVQPAFEIGTHGPPAYEGQGGVLAREMGVLAEAPVLAARPHAVAPLLAALASGSGVADVPGLRTGVLDDVRVSIDEALASRLRASPAEPVISGVLSAAVDDVQAVPPCHAAPLVSVVIATYRRAGLLAACLESFVAQDIPPTDFEVVVVDDGSGDTTPEVLGAFARRLPLVAVRIAHAGRSAAKNIGVLVARGHLVLFFDDDDVATPPMLDAHVRAHREHPEPELAILGHTSWSPGLTVSPVMHYLTDVGMLLFSYPKLTPGQQLDFRYFWEGRLSCKRAFLLANGLHDQRLEYTIDIELGYRLALAGLKVVYEPAALSHMARPVGFDDFLRRCEGKGRAAFAFSRLQPHPAVREYCRIDVATGEWPDRAGPHEADVARVRALERRAGRDQATADPAVLEELHPLYQRAFQGSTFKAIAEAASDGTGPLLTVVVPVWSVTPQLADLAHRTVERIWEVASVTTEVIVVDNGSPHPRDLRASSVVRWAENRGVAPAWNAGAGAGRGRFLAFVNSDATVEPGWDAALCAAADGRRIVFPYTDHCDGLGFRRPDKAGTAGWAFVLSRALFDELGPFDEAFAPAYFEDTDYWHRAFVSGVSLNPVPAARVRHARRTTALHLDGFAEIFERNRRLYERKHGLGFDAAPPYWNRMVEDYVPRLPTNRS